MSQNESIEFLKKNKGKWVTCKQYREYSNVGETTSTRNLNKVYKWYLKTRGDDSPVKRKVMKEVNHWKYFYTWNEEN